MNNEIATNYVKAIEVHRRITLNAQLAQTAIVEICKGLKMMKDEKLYESLGYGEFEEYAEKEFNIKRRQAYKYISIAENLNKNFVQSTAQIGTEKLYLLSTLSEEQQTEKEIAKLKAEISRRAGQQPESPEKIKFKILLTAAYDSVQRAVEFVRSVDNSQNRELYLKQIRKIMTLIN